MSPIVIFGTPTHPHPHPTHTIHPYSYSSHIITGIKSRGEGGRERRRRCFILLTSRVIPYMHFEKAGEKTIQQQFLVVKILNKWCRHIIYYFQQNTVGRVICCTVHIHMYGSVQYVRTSWHIVIAPRWSCTRSRTTLLKFGACMSRLAGIGVESSRIQRWMEFLTLYPCTVWYAVTSNFHVRCMYVTVPVSVQ